MKGARKDNPVGFLPSPGDYGLDPRGDWYGMTPNCHLANLSAHDVREHADGTICVHPSILVTMNGVEMWHGYLLHGVWQSCG